MTDQLQDLTNNVKRLAQASLDKTPEIEDQISQQTGNKILTTKGSKAKKPKTTPPKDCMTLASSKTPFEASAPMGQATPMEGPLASSRDTTTGDNASETTAVEL
ncbi:hypothetical protein PTTG_00777 [Puccinia triticina 1-1 BBBD Race 1]|uniref:Uncharacterized protein n=1 Tax=Puccinia triticina (isolate 1-1 / race 1 (BBBD)) TaxID=630390 RepID=A0A0C4EJ60_PUCT1|nr:hypothetical protein PTTG_00777 [Puccinia triticina 1-1 BBBD Race 1]